MTRDPYSTLLPEGQYLTAYVDCEQGHAFGSRRWFGHFRITEFGEFQGQTLLRVWNEPRRDFLPRSHNLYLDYVQLIGRRPPSRGLKPDDFLKGCEVLSEVVTVRHRIDGRRKIPFPEDCRYSKISRLIRITTGSPPCVLPREGSR